MNKQWKIWRRVCCGVVALAAAWLLLAWLSDPAEPAAGPLRHDIEPLQKRLGAGLGIRSAQWRARRSHAETGLIPYQDNALVVYGVIESDAAAALVEAAEDKHKVQVSFEEILVQETAWESPALLEQLTTQLQQRINKPMGFDQVTRFAWCPAKQQLYIELLLY